ncbi:MAG: tyrosine-type recombinase/integrase [Bifidobacteriaceae bacterium]|nr:tyrosine-type recombinase/integrase [Bifidobacteriaceae bacterium]
MTGAVDLSKWSEPPVGPAAAGSRRLLADWGERMWRDGVGPGTVSQRVSHARRFLVYLESAGVGGVDQARVVDAEGFLRVLRATCAPPSMRVAKNMLSQFARFAGRVDLAECFARVAARRKRSPLTVLTDAEVAAVGAACRAADPRDAAMVLLALMTGLRGCDICAMELEHIDWRAGRINIFQQKTGNLLTLPLPAPAGNAMKRYILDARPATTDRHVFIRSHAPYVGLSGNGVPRRALGRVFGAAGVVPRQLGTRLTRHSLASRMLASRVAAPTIAAVLGHADPGSVDAYLDTDAESMLGCVLPLPEAARL